MKNYQINAAVVASILASLMAPRPASAGTPAPPAGETRHGLRGELDGTQVGMGLGLYRAQYASESLSGPTTGATAALPMTPSSSASLSLNLGHGNPTDPRSSTAFMSIGLEYVYSPLGPMNGETYAIMTDDRTVLAARKPKKGGPKISLGVSQYYFNASDRALPFSGVSFGIGWEEPVVGALTLGVGTAVDELRNGPVSMRVIRAQITAGWIPGG